MPTGLVREAHGDLLQESLHLLAAAFVGPRELFISTSAIRQSRLHTITLKGMFLAYKGLGVLSF